MVCFNQTKSGGEPLGSDGLPLHLESSSSTGWEMVEASDFLYRFQLAHKGEVPDTKLLMLPGPTTLYWFGSTLLEAGPPPFPVDSLELDPVMEIPRSAVESVPGIRYLLDTIPILPESLVQTGDTHPAQTRSSGPHRADRIGRIGRLCSSVGRSTVTERRSNLLTIVAGVSQGNALSRKAITSPSINLRIKWLTTNCSGNCHLNTTPAPNPGASRIRNGPLIFSQNGHKRCLTILNCRPLNH